MRHSRTAHAFLIGCLAALATFCALHARGGETYAIVAQSTRESAATGRRPIAERIASANLPLVAQGPNVPRVAWESDRDHQENTRVAAVVGPPTADEPEAAPQHTAESGRQPRETQSVARSFWKVVTESLPASFTR